MDAVEFLKESSRMCEAFNDNCKSKDGNNFYCGLRHESNKNEESCDEYIKNHPDKAVAIVEKWSEEHPQKTRQSELLKIFSNARRWNNFIDLCPQMIEKFDCPQKHGMDNWKSCTECKGQYWNEEIE